MEIPAIRAFEAFILLLCGPIRYLVSHDLMPRWADPALLTLHTTIVAWWGMTRYFLYAPQPLIDQLAELYGRVWDAF